MPRPTLSLKATVVRKPPALASDMKQRLEALQQPHPVLTTPIPAALPSDKAELDALYQKLKQLPVVADYHPLAIGVKVALLEQANAGTLGLTAKELIRVMGWHCNSTRYLKALANDGSFRHDLDGNPVEPVSDAHREYAIRVLKERAQKHALQNPKAQP